MPLTKLSLCFCSSRRFRAELPVLPPLLPPSHQFGLPPLLPPSHQFRLPPLLPQLHQFVSSSAKVPVFLRLFSS